MMVWCHSPVASAESCSAAAPTGRHDQTGHHDADWYCDMEGHEERDSIRRAGGGRVGIWGSSPTPAQYETAMAGGGT